MSKGIKQRPYDKKKFDSNWDKIFTPQSNVVPGDPNDDILVSSHCTFGLDIRPVDKQSQRD